LCEVGRVHVSAYEASTRKRVLAKTLPFKMWDEVVPGGERGLRRRSRRARLQIQAFLAHATR